MGLANLKTEALSTVWLGLTMQCAVCHSHKFDPVSQKEFYSLYSYFYSMADAAMDGNALLPPPILKLPRDSDTAKIKELDGLIGSISQQIAAELAKTQYVDPLEGTDPPADALTVVKQEFVWIDDDLPAGAQAQGDSPWKFVTKAEGPVFAGEKASTRTATALSQHFWR